MTKKFKSICDKWVPVLFIAVIIGTALAIWQTVNEAGQLPPLMLLVSGASIVLILWIYFATYYVIADQTLRIYHGPFRWKIALSQIESIDETRSPIASPALSLNRLRITYAGGKHVMVSPERRSEFVSLLRQGSA
ncbi:MAG: PH domain-containing protein [Gammaproteobacteria bacterium]|nr:PH domain-containing protein [Gammaproteobacteria bacterium]